VGALHSWGSWGTHLPAVEGGGLGQPHESVLRGQCSLTRAELGGDKVDRVSTQLEDSTWHRSTLGRTLVAV
jgi:hypothetical protein